MNILHIVDFSILKSYHRSDCTGFTLHAASVDMKVGLKYFNLFEKCVVVTDIHWVENLVNVFRFMVPYPIRVFHNSDLNDAIVWVANGLQ